MRSTDVGVPGCERFRAFATWRPLKNAYSGCIVLAQQKGLVPAASAARYSHGIGPNLAWPDSPRHASVSIERLPRRDADAAGTRARGTDEHRQPGCAQPTAPFDGGA